MHDFEQWEIYEARVPFADVPEKSKLRPVVIISPTEVLVLKMTSHGHSSKPKPFEYELLKWEDAGLKVKTFVECDHYVRLRKEQFTEKRYGRLSAADIIGVRQMMGFYGLTIT